MYLCVSEAELENLEKQFREYGNKVVEICGEGVSIRSIRNDEKEKEKRYLEYVKECKTKQEKERERAKLRELEELKAKKELQNKLLNEEITKMRAEREKKKMEEEDAIKKIEEKIKKAADNEKDIIKKEKKLIINYYDELMKTLDKELNIIEKRKKNLQTLISNTIELSEGNLHYFDIVNDNKRKQKAESQKLDSNGDKSKAEAELVDLNSNPITSEFGLMNSTDSLSNSLLSLKGSDGVRTGDDNVVIIDQNSNLNSTLYSSRLTLESEEHYFQTNATTFREYENEKTCKKDKEEIWRSVSQRNVAANEALRNKIKVLKSEFGISNIDAELQCNSTSQNSLVCISDSKTIKNGSEYNILTCESDVIKVKPVVSHIDIIKESKSFPKEANKCEGNICLKNADSICLKDALNFREVSLERKRECFNLEKPSEELKLGNADVKITNSESFSSFITPPNEKLSEENVSTSHSDEEMIPNSSQGTNSVINEKYQNALVRDSEISSQNLVYDDIFESLNHLEFEKLPCTELMEFQRYLKKSAIIPLMIQEKLASDALLKHLLVGENLLSHLKSLRSFFFLNDGEFGRSFTYNTFRSLAKCIESSEFFERSNLSDIVNEALNYTIHGGDKNTQNLSFKIVKMPPFLNHSSHDVLSPFELSYKVNWPLNIILTEKALSKYKSIFKFLLKLKRIIWTLNENFLYLNSFFKNKKINSRVLMGSPQYHKVTISEIK